MSTVFKALSDPTRRRVLELLRKGPMAAGELSDQFTVSKPTMSAHFAVLREANLVDAIIEFDRLTLDKKQNLADRSRTKVAERFTWKIVAEEHMNIFGQIYDRI